MHLGLTPKRLVVSPEHLCHFGLKYFGLQLFVPAHPANNYASPAPRAHLSNVPVWYKARTTRGNFDAQKGLFLEQVNRSQYASVN